MNGGRRRDWAWAALAAAAFVAVAGRTLSERGPTFLQGDLALLHVDSLRAAGLHQLLGPYDRFGWHHPGPVYAYLMSVADRLVGFTRPLQSEALIALVIDGSSLVAAVALARRHLGPGPAAGVLGFGCLAAVGLGNDVVFNPWSPTVVILPTVLLGVLAVAAVVPGVPGGDAVATAPTTAPPAAKDDARRHSSSVPTGPVLPVTALLVATFCLQTDLGTLPLVAPLVVVVMVAPLVVRLVRRRRPEPPPPGGPANRRGPARSLVRGGWAAAGLTAVAAWIPVLVQEWSSPRGNLTRIVAFFRAGHAHAGLTAGARAAGWAQLAVFGHRPPGAPPIGTAGSWAAIGAVVAAAVLLGVGLRLHRPLVVAGAGLWLAGTGLAVLAGAEIVGPPYSYLTYWAAAPLAGAAVGLGDLAGHLWAGLRSHRRPPGALSAGGWETALLLVGLLGVSALTADLLSRRSVVSYSPEPVAAAWSDLRSPVSGAGAVGVAFPNQAAAWSVGTGLVDRLEAGGHPVTVLPFWSNQVAATSRRAPTTWISVLPAGGTPPPGAWRAVGSVGAVRLFVGARPAPGAG